MAKKLDPKVRSFAIAALRRASLRWPPRAAAFRRARVSRGVYRCENCTGEFKRRDLHADHETPVVDVTGYQSMDDYIMRLFIPAGGYNIYCKACHEIKTQEENKLRREIKSCGKKLVEKDK